MKIIVFFFLMNCCITAETQTTSVYTFYYSTGTPLEYGIYNMDGTFTTLITYDETEFQYLDGGSSIINETEMEYTVRGRDEDYILRLITVDLSTGNIKYSPYVVDAAWELQYSCVQNKIFGVWAGDGSVHVVSTDKITGEKTIVGTYPEIEEVTPFTSSLDPLNDHYLFRGKDLSGNKKTYVVNLSDGELLYEHPLSEGLNWRFNCNDEKFYGVYDDAGVFYFASMDAISGVLTTITTLPEMELVSGVFSVLLPDEELYITRGEHSDNNIYTYNIDVTSGTFTTFPADENMLEPETLMCCSAIDEASSNAVELPGVNIYPDPVFETMHVKLAIPVAQNAVYSITNSIGQTVVSQTPIITLSQVSINTTQLSPGIYYFVVSGNKTTYSKAFVKM
ncbi:MAG: T9SS type A sorting domain-containing protein [Fimbriimonadaceae bacterium]|nr:T9SS type A sorting domain-containing protein [Chitinophagales bacterium]